LELEVYESKRLPILDPSKLTEQERSRIEKAFLKLCQTERKGSKEGEIQAMKELDNIVFGILGLSIKERKQVYEGLRSLRQTRTRRKEVKILVDTEEEWEPPKRRRRKKETPAEPYKRIDSFF